MCLYLLSRWSCTCLEGHSCPHVYLPALHGVTPSYAGMITCAHTLGHPCVNPHVCSWMCISEAERKRARQNPLQKPFKPPALHRTFLLRLPAHPSQLSPAPVTTTHSCLVTRTFSQGCDQHSRCIWHCTAGKRLQSSPVVTGKAVHIGLVLTGMLPSHRHSTQLFPIKHSIV